MQTIHQWRLANGAYNQFPPKTTDIPPGTHIVEYLADGRTIVIKKPGYKAQRGCPHDFQVVIAGDNQPEDSVSHSDLLTEFAQALQHHRALGEAFIERAFSIFAGAEAPDFYPNVGTQRPAEAILKALKWILAQEDVNYPILNGKLGRRMLAERLVEVLHGTELTDVLRRASFQGGRPPTRLVGVDYTIVDLLIPWPG